MLISFLLCSCSGNRDSEKADVGAKVYIESDNALDLCIYNTDTLNPLKTSAKHNAEVLSLLYDSLFTVTSSFEAIPNVCESFTVSENGLVYSFKIRNNIKFQNGKTLSAKDVTRSIESIMSSDGYYKSRLDMIRYTAFSDTHVRIHLNRPTENFCVLLDFPILYNGGDYQKKDNILYSVPSGSGLYLVSEYFINKKISLSINKNHHSGDMPFIENINIHIAPDISTAISMFESGQIDMMTGDAIDYEHYTLSKSLSYKEYNDTDLVFIGINTDDKKTFSKDVRAYISEELSKVDLSDIPYSKSASFPVHPDADNSNFIFEKASVQNFKDTNGNGIVEEKSNELSFELLVNKDNPKKVFLAERIKSSLIKSGINIKIRAFSFEKYKEKIASSDYDLFLGEFSLLPNFDTLNLKRLVNFSELSDIPFGCLYFKNGVLIYSKTIKIDKIETLNPYKSVVLFNLS